MSKKDSHCVLCTKFIDTANDAHEYCAGKEKHLICTSCATGLKRCPTCGKNLQHHSDSITKEAFYSPSTRSFLGF